MSISITKTLEAIMRKAFDAAGIEAQQPLGLKESTRPEFGDYQINGVVAVANRLKKSPRELANQVVAAIQDQSIIEKLEVAGPGFINITLNPAYLNQSLNREDLLTPKPAQPLTVVVDYSSPNLAKEMHVGHLRSTIIGDALVRLHEFLGNRVIRRNHVGDWGTQFGMLLAYLHELTQSQQDLTLELKNLEDFYRKAKLRFDADDAFAQRAREFVVKLQTGDTAIQKTWQQFVNISLSHCQEIYQRLQVKLTPEDAVGESFYNSSLPIVVADLVAKGLAIEDEGAKCIFFSKQETQTNEETSPFIIQKKDGGYLYATTDIAAVQDRVNNLQGDQLIYVVDSRQALHLKQLFLTVKKAGIARAETRLEHVAFGTMLGPDHRPFKTRSGDTIKLTALLDEAAERARQLIIAKNPHWNMAEVEALAEKLGIAAIKYADLSKNRICDYLFNLDQMLSFEGNTAPYLLYAYVRIQSLFQKNGLALNEYLAKRTIQIQNLAERNLALHLIKFVETVQQATLDSYPHYICNYLYTLSGLFMRFYESCPILQAEEATVQTSRLGLAALTAEVLRLAMGLLGIAVVTKM